MTTRRRWTVRALLACVAVLVHVTAAHAQGVQIYASDDVNFKLGILGQFQGDTITDLPNDANSNNLFIRRLRLMFAGNVTKRVSFFVETDNPNLGKAAPPTGKTTQPTTLVSTFIQDAYGEFKVDDRLMLDAGLMFVPFSHNALQSAATLLPIDYGAYTFSQSVPTESLTGRDAGFQARGYFLEHHLEYRIGAFQGDRDVRSHQAFRYVGRVEYDFLDTDTGFFYAGTYLGKKKIVSVGAAFDTQKKYHAYVVDGIVDLPLGPGALTAQANYNQFDGDITFPSLPKQHDVLAEGGYYISALKIEPVVQFNNRAMVGTSTGDENRWSAGLNYWWAGHNANIKAAYSRVNPTALPKQNEFTVQLQLYYF